MIQKQAKKGKRKKQKAKQNDNKIKTMRINMFILSYQQTSMNVQVSRVKTTRPALTGRMDTAAAVHQVLTGHSAK